MGALHFTEQNFENEVLKSDSPVLVDFWAEWCGPCKMIAPVIEEIATEFEGKIKIGKVNVVEAQGIATKYGIMSIPTLMVFKDGAIVDQIVGALGKEQLSSRLNQYL